jgi:hypothetical protein
MAEPCGAATSCLVTEPSAAASHKSPSRRNETIGSGEVEAVTGEGEVLVAVGSCLDFAFRQPPRINAKLKSKQPEIVWMISLKLFCFTQCRNTISCSNARVCESAVLSPCVQKGFS